VKSGWPRAALSHRICTGIPRRRLAKLIEELADPWQAQHESKLRVRRGGRDRLRAEGAGPDRELVFVDRVIATLVILRFQLPHAALAVFYGVDRSTITRAVHEIRPLLARRGFAVPGKPGLRLHTLADVFAYAAAEGVHLRIDGTEVQVRRPRANRPGRRAFVSGKRKQNTKKDTVISDGNGRLVWLGATRPGRMHDATALRTEGIEDLLRQHPQVRALVDAGYQGLARDFPDQVSAPPLKPAKNAPPEDITGWEQARKAQSSARICVEHAIAEPKQWRSLQRWIGRREYFEETALAIAGLVSDRTAERATRHRASTELVLARPPVC
jgi:DDE superfamily endonuclease/Helix-turn-helix of DDE superfamily endonuclease